MRASTSATGARETPGIRVLEGVEGRAVQPSGSNRAKSRRSESGSQSGRVVETLDEPPSTFVSKEDMRLVIVSSSDD